MTTSTWPSDALKQLSEFATDAHARIQQEFSHINPVVGVRRGMREKGIPADAMTIDCLTSGKRIVLVLHDGQADTLIYQFAKMDDDSDAPYQQHAFSALSADVLFGWMRDYFSPQ